jgi:hypothetical protein
MTLSGLLPADVSAGAALAICAVAFVAGTARVFPVSGPR